MNKNISYQRVFAGLILVVIITVYSLFTEEPDIEFSVSNIFEAFWVIFKQMGVQAVVISLLLEIYNTKSKDTPPKLLFIGLGIVAWAIAMTIGQQLFFPEEGTIKESLMAGAFIGGLLSWGHHWMIEQEHNAI